MEKALDLNLYEILNISPKANSVEIKKAYRREAKKYHPDNEHYNKEKWSNLQLAYEILSDEEKRKTYNKNYYSKYSESYFFNNMNVEDAIFLYDKHQEREEEIWKQYNQIYYEILLSLENNEEIKIIKEHITKLENKKCNNILDIIRVKKEITYLKNRIEEIKQDYLIKINIIKQERIKLLKNETIFLQELMKVIVRNANEKQARKM